MSTAGRAQVRSYVATRGMPLRGEVVVPGDKSVSHRAIMLGAIAAGTTRIEGFLEGEDTRATAAIFAQLGVRIDAPSPGVRIVHGAGLHGLQAAAGPLDCGNAGTAMRLLAGLLAGQGFDTVLVGDESLSRRPMRRVIEPLAAMGAVIESNKHFEAAKYVSQTEHQRNLSALYVNEKKLASLPKDLQEIVLQAGKEAAVYERKKDAELVAAAADRLKSRGAVLTSPDKSRFIQLIARIQDEVARELKATELLQLVRGHQM